MEGKKVRKNVVFRLSWKSRSKMASMAMVMALMVAALPADVDASRGPPRISDVVEPIVGNIGETLRLPCPVDGEPAPLFEWFKDGESLIMADDRIRATKNGLKITDAEVDDSGIYECKAVNGFGQVSIEVELWIRDSPSMSGGGSNYDDEEEEFDEDGFHRPNSISKSHQHGSSSGPAGGPSPDTTPRVPTPPTIVDHSWGDGAGPMMGGVFRQIPGSGIRLRCVVLGEPRPWVKWYKDGMEQSGSDWRSKVESRWSFVIENLKRADSGVYTCRAGNKLGTVSVNFTLEIFDDMTDKPEMMDEHPMNTTVITGESTTLQCRVKSDSQPRIQWLKRLESRSEEAKYLNDSVPLQGDRYRILNTSTTTTVAKDTYLNRLVVTATKKEDSGLYVCLAANKMGYSFRKAFLTVEPSPLSPAIAEEISPNGVGFVPETSPSLYIVFSLVALVVVILVASIAMYYFKRKYSPVGRGTVSSLRNGSLGTMGPHGGLMNGVSAGGMGTTGMVGHFDGVGLGMPGFGSGSPNGKKAAIVVANGNGSTGRHILSNQQQQQPFLTHHLDTQQPTAVLGGLRGVQPSLGDDYLTRQQQQQQQQREGFRYKLVPQQETPPAPPYPHQTGIYRESSSDVSSSHLYQKLPLGSSAASPNGLSIGPGSRSTPDNASNCRLCVVAGYQGFPGQHHHHNHQQQQLHQQPPRGYPGRGNGVESCREFVHFTSGMSHPV